MDFPIAGVSVNPIALMAVGFLVGILGDIFGVGGGFLAAPFMFWIGVPMNFVVGTALAVVVGTLLSVLKRFFRQACALECLGVIASIRRGWAVVRYKPADVLVMWLIMLCSARLGRCHRPQFPGVVPPPDPVHRPGGSGRRPASLPGLSAVQPGL